MSIATLAVSIITFFISIFSTWASVLAEKRATKATLTGAPYNIRALEELDTQVAKLEARVRYLRAKMYVTCPPIEPEISLYANTVASVAKACNAVENLITNVESKLNVPEELPVPQAGTSAQK